MAFLNIVEQLSMSAAYTILVTFSCALSAFMVGFILTILNRLNQPIVLKACDTFSFIFRAIPILPLIFLVYFGLPAIDISLSPLETMCIVIGAISGSYIYELMRGMLTTIEPTQLLAARMFGLTKKQIFLNIELPQALRFSTPGIINEFTVILKYSPFSYVVGIPEITRNASILSTTSNHAILIYTTAGILYYLIYKLFHSITLFLEKKYQIPGINEF
ncbi:ABC transporter permease subunit [Vibrio sp. S4M6]|uniref:ABC transporter permease subunit n=1 Tax=Vibrio sinus TaxID=2946865 RepID=UPI00202A0332|nr:ABC transporter permease subunit [Vibrio sinus]MCL9781995.1 ABC transporter permease subunit [Vibrio sinus]